MGLGDSWVLYQDDWCLYEKPLGHRNTQWDEHVKTEDEDYHLLQAKERSLRTPLLQTSSLQNCDKTQSVVLHHGSPSKLIYPLFTSKETEV